MKKKVKDFNSQKYNEVLAESFKNRSEAKELHQALQQFKDCKTVDEIDKFLTDKTGFVNVQMSAAAMDLENEYNTVIKHLGKIDLNIYEADYTKLTAAYIDNLREQYTIYWSDADAKIIDKVNKSLKTINEMNIKAGFGFNNLNQLVFNEKHWNVWNQLNRPKN